MKMQAFIFAVVFALVFPLISMAQGEPPQPHFLDGILGFLQNGWLQAGAVMLFEAFLRVKPTYQPKSLLIVVKYALDGGVVILSWVSALTEKLIAVGNNVKR